VPETKFYGAGTPGTRAAGPGVNMFFRTPLTLLQMDRFKQVSPERPNWKISSGDLLRHLQSHDRAETGQGFLPRRRKDPFPG
jgi:hypothetical protein